MAGKAQGAGDSQAVGVGRPENPPAFPSEILSNVRPGMDLRDYFASQALVALVAAATKDPDAGPTIVAEDAYRVADAMLAERSK